MPTLTDSVASSASLVLGATPRQLSLNQTGTGASTNIAEIGPGFKACLLDIVTTVGATPSVTVAIEGSVDGTNWYAVPYADPATPTTAAVATFAITTATRTRKYVLPGYPYRFIRLNLSANTNVTLADATLYVF